jgi:putative ABC transport system permease protein
MHLTRTPAGVAESLAASPLIELDGVRKVYRAGRLEYPALRGIDLAISMVGLVNSITMSMLERTREIGILRCVGARARDLRRIFGSEGLLLALLGWLAGIPLGYAVDRLLVWLVRELIEVEVPVTYPAADVALALAGTAALALLVMALPLRRAVRLKPGDAHRYA